MPVPHASPNLAVLLRDYMNLRKAERSEWSRYGQQKGTTDDLKAVSQAMIYLKDHEFFTLEDLDTALQGVNEKARVINADMLIDQNPHEDFYVMNGNRALIKREKFERYLDQATAV